MLLTNDAFLIILQGLSFHLWLAVAMEVSTTTAMMLAVVVPSLLMVAKFLWDHVSALHFEWIGMEFTTLRQLTNLFFIKSPVEHFQIRLCP